MSWYGSIGKFFTRVLPSIFSKIKKADVLDKVGDMVKLATEWSDEAYPIVRILAKMTPTTLDDKVVDWAFPAVQKALSKQGIVSISDIYTAVKDKDERNELLFKIAGNALAGRLGELKPNIEIEVEGFKTIINKAVQDSYLIVKGEQNAAHRED